MHLQQSRLNTKKILPEWRSPCHFEIVIFKEFFSFINFTFVPNELVTQSEIKYFLTSS